MYVESVGCTRCKLQLHKWKEFIAEVDPLTFGSEYEMKPILPESATTISIRYNVDDNGRFNKTVSVYGNIDNSRVAVFIW